MSVILERTTNHDRFAEFYKESGLEIDTEHWIEDNCPIWSVAAWEDGLFRGAATVSLRNDRYILDYIAVSRRSRGRGLGRLLAEDCLERCRDAGCGELYLTARAPLFFEALGARYTGGGELPDDCRGCPDFGRDCRPEEMKFVLRPSAENKKGVI
ncbi:MAG: GNAT family N-acetyltransferase [Oscillospiraceae bacterium]|nr:GNAT family N-acetyltransferase [Oscillospiraceae bacterium]